MWSEDDGARRGLSGEARRLALREPVRSSEPRGGGSHHEKASCRQRGPFQCRTVDSWLRSGACPATNPNRDVYFGQTHVHTSWSFDAYVFGNTLAGPEEAYQYALGQPIRHPAATWSSSSVRLTSRGSRTIRSTWARSFRRTRQARSISKLPIAEKLKVGGPADVQRVYLFLGESLITEPIKELTSPEVAGTVWKDMVRIADKYNQPGKFTTFVGVRVDLDARQPEHASQCVLQGLEEGARVALHLDRFGPPRGSLDVDGRSAQGGQRGARDLAQREPVRWRHVSRRRRQQGAAHRRRMGGIEDAQRDAVRDPATQGCVGDTPERCRRTTNLQATKY